MFLSKVAKLPLSLSLFFVFALNITDRYRMSLVARRCASFSGDVVVEDLKKCINENEKKKEAKSMI